MNLAEFVLKEARPMPVFLLVDASGSMEGQKISSVNAAVRNMIAALSNIDDVRGQIKVCVIRFGSDVEIIQPLEKVENISWVDLKVEGVTSMGQALTLVNNMIEDKTIVETRSYTPTIVLISDGYPTDLTEELNKKRKNNMDLEQDYLEWEPIKMIHKSERTSKCIRLAMGIGKNASYNMLKAFVNNDKTPVISAKDSSGIARFFEWVTMSVTTRSVSNDPNKINDIPLEELFEIDELR